MKWAYKNICTIVWKNGLCNTEYSTYVMIIFFVAVFDHHDETYCHHFVFLVVAV